MTDFNTYDNNKSISSTPRQSHQVDQLSPLAVGNQKLIRHLGFFSGTMINVGQIIGTGIFSNPTFILINCGSGGMMLILWIVGALFAGAGVWNYLELGTMLPRSGGEQEYLAYQYPNPKKLLSFVFLIMYGIFGRGAGLAQSSDVFGSNIIYAIGGNDYVNYWGARGFGVFCLTFWLVLNIMSSKVAIRAVNVFSVIKILLLVLLICVGFAGLAGRFPDGPNLAENFSLKGTVKDSSSYASAIYFVVFAYSGWNNLNYVIDELEDPVKNLPRCAITALSLTTVLYFLANVAYLAVLPIAVIKASNVTVAANLFEAAFGGIFGSHILPVFVGLSSFGTVGSSFYAGSRILLEASRKGYLPFDHFFSKVHPKLQTPINTLVLLYSISLLCLLAPPPGSAFQFIIAFSGYGDYFFACLCVIGLLILRHTQPDIKRPIKAPIVVSIAFIAVCLFTLIFVFVPPVSKAAQYPYYLPYIISITLGLVSIVLWYFKLVVKDSLTTCYNANMCSDGEQELFEYVFTDSISEEKSQSIDNDKIVQHIEFQTSK